HLLGLYGLLRQPENYIYSNSHQLESKYKLEPEINAQNRLAKQLVSFRETFGAEGYCYVKLTSGQWIVKTDYATEELTAEQLQKRDTIRRMSRMVYGRPVLPPEEKQTPEPA